MRISFRLGSTTADSPPTEHLWAVEANLEAIKRSIHFTENKLSEKFLNLCRKLAYSLLLGYTVPQATMSPEDLVELHGLLRHLQLLTHSTEADAFTAGEDVRRQEESEELLRPSRAVLCDLTEANSSHFGCREMKKPAQI
jgi:hypothetical protein